jgi:hypothetical protein
LHETSDLELPYWKKKQDGASDESHTQICLFLGAVRDMSDSENAILRRLCINRDIPYTGIRIGPVAEFTSKILTIIAYHHAHGRLCSAVEDLINNDFINESVAAMGRTPPIISSAVTALDVIYLVSLSSTELVLDLERRTPAIWNLVRCTVVTLWRSRLAGGSHRTTDSLVNRLTIVFDDAVCITLTVSDVQTMADAHQAAPCEHQIIKLLIQRIGESKRDELTSTKGTTTHKELALSVACQLVDGKDIKSIHALCLTGNYDDKDEAVALADFCYHLQTNVMGGIEAPNMGARTVLVLLSQRTPEEDKSRWGRAFLRAFRKLNITVSNFTLQCALFTDERGASITLLQHFCYQNRLLQLIQSAQPFQAREAVKTRKRRKI